MKCLIINCKQGETKATGEGGKSDSGVQCVVKFRQGKNVVRIREIFYFLLLSVCIF